MRIWIDILTPKQARFLGSISKKLDHEYLITTRHYRHCEGILKLIGVEEYEVIGEYGKTLKDKLQLSLKRQEKLEPIIKNFDPDIILAHASTEAAYMVGDWLKKPLIFTCDCPHSVVNRIILPHTFAHVRPSFLNFEYPWPKRIITYNGLPEVSYVKDHKSKGKSVLDKLDLDPDEFIVFRPVEKFAHYYEGYDDVDYQVYNAVKDLVEKIVIFPRYSEIGWNQFDPKIKIADETIDTLGLYEYARAVITGGSSMAVESCLLGIPSISTFPIEYKIFDFLRENDFPIVNTKERNLSLIREIVENSKKRSVDVNKLEDPIEKIKALIEQLEKNNL